MTYLALLAGLFTMFVPALLHKLRLDLRPAVGARVSGTCVGAALIVSQLSLAGIGVLTLLSSSAPTELRTDVAAFTSHLAPGGVVVQVAALGAGALQFSLMAASALRLGALRRRASSCEHLGARSTVAGHDVVVVPCADPIALTASSGQIVLSTALLTELHEHEIAAIVRHEAAHRRLGHHRLLAIAAIVEASFPRFIARRATAPLRLHVERWADEIATSNVRERVALSNALARIGAAVGVDVEGRLSSLAASTRTDLSGHRRIAYLLAAAPVLAAAVFLSDWAAHVSIAVAGISGN